VCCVLKSDFDILKFSSANGEKFVRYTTMLWCKIGGEVEQKGYK
jgi:hypothetical protein